MSIAVHPFDTLLYRDTFATEEMREVFSELARLRSWIAFEAALARGQAEMDMIPWGAANAIAVLDGDDALVRRVAELYRDTRLDTVAFVRALSERCDPDAARYLHWGSTTTDILDSGLALQLSRAMDIIERDVRHLRERLCRLADEHRATLMVARTHSQHALPITLGFKFALWVDDLTHHLDRARELRRRLLVAKVTGVVGSQAAYGERGLELQRRVCAHLGLLEPDASVQSSRARLQEFVFFAALVGNSLQQIAKEVWTRQRPEIGELSEGFAAGTQVGSTTLAFKRNPVRCEWLLGYARLLRGHVSTLLENVMEDERDGARVASEYEVVPSACLIVARALATALELVAGMEIHVERLRANIDVTHGFVYSEAVMMELARSGLGKQVSHEILYDCAGRCIAEGIGLKQAMLEDPRVTARLDGDVLDGIMRPEAYLGTIPQQIDAALERAGCARGREQT